MKINDHDYKLQKFKEKITNFLPLFNDRMNMVIINDNMCCMMLL